LRIGLLSDVHGNLAGLRAVAAALGRAAPDRVVVAGDLLWGGPRPLEVWQFLQQQAWTLVRGNADDELSEGIDNGFPPGNPYREAALRHRDWLLAQLEPTVIEALKALPLEHRITTSAGDLLVVHSSPRSTTDQCGAPHNTLAEVRQAYSGTGANAIAFGHWHAAFVRQTPFALLVNVASVGLPLDRQARAAFTILTATDDGEWLVEQQRVAYDQAEEQAAAIARGQPAWVPSA
jgi:putative phosphoesterase